MCIRDRHRGCIAGGLWGSTCVHHFRREDKEIGLSRGRSWAIKQFLSLKILVDPIGSSKEGENFSELFQVEIFSFPCQPVIGCEVALMRVFLFSPYWSACILRARGQVSRQLSLFHRNVESLVLDDGFDDSFLRGNNSNRTEKIQTKGSCFWSQNKDKILKSYL